MKEKEKLFKEIERSIHSIHKNRNELNEIVEKLEHKHDVPEDVALDLIGLKVELQDQPEELLFWLLDVLVPNSKSKYFNATEIKSYENGKFKVKKLRFPLKFKMVQITDTQWIGVTDVKQLMMFRDAQLINYNENAQRTLTKVVREGCEYYKISLNNKAVNEIKELYLNGTYIPNTITLNMPEETDYYYNSETNELVIKSIKQFDILDGYHRYITMSRIYNTDKKFNYPMSLQIVFFNESKARQFIFQEDQKTKMSKVDSDSFNQNNHGNKVISLLKQKATMTGLINNKDGIIDETAMAHLIDAVYFNDKRKKFDIKDEITITKNIDDKLSRMFFDNPDILIKRWNREFLAAAVYLTSRDDISIEEYGNTVAKLYEKLLLNKENFPTRAFTKREITRLQKIYEGKEGELNV